MPSLPESKVMKLTPKKNIKPALLVCSRYPHKPYQIMLFNFFIVRFPADIQAELLIVHKEKYK